MPSNELLMRFVEEYSLSEIDPAFILEGINSCLEDCDCDEWLIKYLGELRNGLRFHAIKMRVNGIEAETFVYLFKTKAVRAFNTYCYDDLNEIFLIPEMDKRIPSFSLQDSDLWLSWAEKNQEEIRKQYGRK